MGALFVHTVRMLVRQRDVLIWVILFPLALATLFHVMLSNIDESYRVDPAQFLTLGRATPFAGQMLTGVCTLTMIDGDIVWKEAPL